MSVPRLLCLRATGGWLQSPEPVETGFPLRAITASRCGDSQVVVCYRTNDTLASGLCRAATVNPGLPTGMSTFSAPLTVPDSVEYQTGALSSFQDDTDRVVLAFSSGATLASPGSKLVVLGVSNGLLTVLSPSTLDRFEFSAATDSLALVSVTRLALVLSYRVRFGVECDSRPLPSPPPYPPKHTLLPSSADANMRRCCCTPAHAQARPYPSPAAVRSSLHACLPRSCRAWHRVYAGT
jgi:hypothetical protein